MKQLVIMHERRGLTPAEIVEEFPHLTLADVHAALAYFHDNRESINAEIAADSAWSDEQIAARSSLVQEKLKAALSHSVDLRDWSG